MHMSFKNYYRYVFIMTSLIFFLIACTRQQKDIVIKTDFHSAIQMSKKQNRVLCIVLLDTAQTTSKIYLQRLEEMQIRLGDHHLHLHQIQILYQPLVLLLTRHQRLHHLIQPHHLIIVVMT